MIGSLGGPELLDRNVAREARGLLAEGKTTLRRFGDRRRHARRASVPVHIRAYAPPPKMFIVGAIDFSAAVAPMAAQIGYEVTISDARDRFAPLAALLRPPRRPHRLAAGDDGRSRARQYA